MGNEKRDDKKKLQIFIISSLIFAVSLCFIVTINTFIIPKNFAFVKLILVLLIFLFALALPNIKIRKSILSMPRRKLFVLNFVGVAIIIIVLFIYQTMQGRLAGYSWLVELYGISFLLVVGAILSLIVTYIAIRLTALKSNE